jgi:hypothetical protein
MIQVQIASQVTPTGVLGTRWVLVDDVDAETPAGAVPAPDLVATAPPDQPSGERGLWSLGLLKLGVTVIGLGTAWWAGQAVLGAPTVRWLAPELAVAPGARQPPRAAAPPVEAAPTLPDVSPAGTEPPALAPADSADPAPAAASATVRHVITAELR